MDSTKQNLDKENDAFVVHRTFRMKDKHDQNNVEEIKNCLGTVNGVRSVKVDMNGAKLSVSYDAAQTDYGVIENTLKDAGYPSRNSGWSNMMSSWYRYLDENAQTNAKSKGGACCSKPSGIYANRRK